MNYIHAVNNKEEEKLLFFPFHPALIFLELIILLDCRGIRFLRDFRATLTDVKVPVLD